MQDYKYLAFLGDEKVYRIVELDQVIGGKMRSRALRPHISVYRSSMVDNVNKVADKNPIPKFNGVAEASIRELDQIEDEYYYVRCVWDEEGDRAHTLITLRAKYNLEEGPSNVDIAMQRVKERIAVKFRVVKEPFKAP